MWPGTRPFLAVCHCGQPFGAESDGHRLAAMAGEECVAALDRKGVEAAAQRGIFQPACQRMIRVSSAGSVRQLAARGGFKRAPHAHVRHRDAYR